WPMTVTGLPWNRPTPPRIAPSSPQQRSPRCSKKSVNKAEIKSGVPGRPAWRAKATRWAGVRSFATALSSFPMQLEQADQGAAQPGPRHDGINEAVLQQVFGPLEALGQLFTDGLLDDAGPREPDQRPRLCQHDIAQAGKAGGDAAGGGVSEHRDIQPPMLRKALDGSGGLGHLHQRE